MSRHETFPSPQNAEPVKLEFEDGHLQEKFANPVETAPPQAEVLGTVPTAALEAYQSERTEWKAAKGTYTEAKQNYEARLTEYYKNYSDKGIFGRGTQKLSEWWSGKPEDLQDLEEEFKAARSTYAGKLNSVLAHRGDVSERYNNFKSKNIDTKKAFAEKFVLNPRKDQLEIEKEHIIDTQTAARAQQVLQTLNKHKWTVRIGAVAATGLAVGTGAGVVAGLGAAGYRAARVAGGMAGGALGAKIGDKIGTEGVEVAEQNLAKTKEDTVKEFTIDNIDELEDALATAENTLDKKEQQRKLSIIAGAIIGGGGLANIDRIGDAAGNTFISSAEAAVPDNPWENAELASETTAPPDDNNIDIGTKDSTASDDPWASAEVLTADDEAGRIADETAEALKTTDPEAKAIAQETAQVLQETDPESKAIAAETMSVLEETRPEMNIGDHMVESGDTLWKITENSYAEKMDTLSESQRNQVLDAVFDDLRKDPALTTELGIKSGNIDLIYPQDNLKMSVLDSLIDEKLQSVIGNAESAGSYMVEKNDTLWSITENRYAAQLDILSESQRDQVLDAVFDDLRKNNDLVAEMGIRSGNIDVIYPNEQLDVSLLESLITDKINAVTTGETATSITTAESISTETAATSETTPEETVQQTTQSANKVEVAQVAGQETRPTITDHGGGKFSAPTAEIAAYQAEIAKHTAFFEAKGAEVFGSRQAFETAKLAALEKVVGRQPPSWGGGGRFNPVFERISGVSLEVLREQNVHQIDQLDRGMALDFLRRVELDGSESNLHDLQLWLDEYKSMIRPGSLQAAGITLKPYMTLDHLFTQYVIANANK